MRLSPLIILFILTLTGCSDTSAPAPATQEAETLVIADTVLENGRIYTVDESRPWAEAVAIKDGRLLVVGEDADVASVPDEERRHRRKGAS